MAITVIGANNNNNNPIYIYRTGILDYSKAESQYTIPNWEVVKDNYNFFTMTENSDIDIMPAINLNQLTINSYLTITSAQSGMQSTSASLKLDENGNIYFSGGYSSHNRVVTIIAAPKEKLIMMQL